MEAVDGKRRAEREALMLFRQVYSMESRRSSVRAPARGV